MAISVFTGESSFQDLFLRWCEMSFVQQWVCLKIWVPACTVSWHLQEGPFWMIVFRDAPRSGSMFVDGSSTSQGPGRFDLSFGSPAKLLADIYVSMFC